MPNSTTNPPVEIGIPPWTVATPLGSPVPAVTTITAYRYYMSRVFAAGSFVTSGVKYLSGTADVKVRAVLCDAGGTVLASSALAPTTNGASAVSEKTLAWTTPYAVTGPCSLWIALQSETSVAALATIGTTAATNTGFLGGVSPDAAGTSYALPTSGVISVPTAYAVSTAPAVSLY